MPAGMRGREGNMKKKLLGLVACVATLALSGALLAGCSGSGDKTGGDSADGKETLTVGFDQSYPPYGFVGDDGQYTGFDLDLAQEVANRNGWDYKAEPVDWDAKDALLGSGQINCIWNGFTIEGREDNYTFSEPYMLNEQVVVVKKGNGINSLSDLAGKTVGVQAASAALDLLQSEEEGGQKELADTFAALQQFPDYNNAFVELQAGSIDAVAMDIGVAKYQLESRGEGYKILDEHLNSEKYAIGFKKGNTELCDKVNEGLQQVLADGTFDKLAEKYGIADMVCLEKKGE